MASQGICTARPHCIAFVSVGAMRNLSAIFLRAFSYKGRRGFLRVAVCKEGYRVEPLATFAYLEMQMGPGRSPSVPHRGDRLSLADRRANGHEVFRIMGIEGGVALRVLDDNDIPVP